MKTIIILFLFINSFNLLNADSLLTRTYNNGNVYDNCIKDNYSYNSTKTKLYYFFSGTSKKRTLKISSVNSYKIKANYTFTNKKCISNDNTSNYTLTSKLPLTHENMKALKLNEEDLNFMFALSGLFCSFLFLFGLFRWI